MKYLKEHFHFLQSAVTVQLQNCRCHSGDIYTDRLGILACLQFDVSPLLPPSDWLLVGAERGYHGLEDDSRLVNQVDADEDACRLSSAPSSPSGRRNWVEATEVGEPSEGARPPPSPASVGESKCQEL